MIKANLFRFLEGEHPSFLEEIAFELNAYELCIEKNGRSCPITVDGLYDGELSEEHVFYLVDQFLLRHVSKVALDYIINGLLLDINIQRSEDVDELLEDVSGFTEECNVVELQQYLSLWRVR